MEFLSNPLCDMCEYELTNGCTLLHSYQLCKKHTIEIEEFLQSEEYQEIKRIWENL